MVPKSLREFLSILKTNGDLKEITAEVNKSWEVSSVARHTYTWPERERPALLFSNVQGFTIPVVVGIFNNIKQYALALGCNEEEIGERWNAGLNHPLQCIEVNQGPADQVVWKGEEANLERLPIPIWCPGKDPGPYLTSACAITRDPETGIINVGTYRCEIQGPNRIGINLHRERHAGIHLTKYEKLGRPMEIALCIGAPPSLMMASVAPIPFGLSELEVAGGLVGTPLQLIPCQTLDLRVPAETEIIIEGQISPGDMDWEGPFGEFTGYMGPKRINPIMRVNCITMREDPIYQGYVSQKPPSEGTTLSKINNEYIIKQKLKDVGITGIVDLNMTEAAGAHFHAVVSIRPMYPGLSREVMTALWGVGRTYFRQIIVVDEDVNVHDPVDVEWAVATRCRPDKDIVIMPDHITTTLDPVMTLEEMANAKVGRTYKYGIDATRSHEYAAVALPDKEYLDMAAASWNKYSLGREIGK